MARPRVGAIVLNYKTPDDTLQAVSSLKATGYEPLDIYVVDNGSDDGLGPRLAKDHPDVRLLENAVNLGFPGGCNVGIRAALENGAQYVLLLNSDALATPGLVSRLVAAFERDARLGVVGPTVLYEDGRRIWYGGGRLNRTVGTTRHPGMGGIAENLADVATPTDFVSGCALLTRRRVLEEIGLLDDAYFLYYDDVDFSERVRQAGYRVAYYPQAVAIHKVSATAGERGSNLLTPLRAYYFARNMVAFIRKHISGPRRWTSLEGQFLIRGPYRLLSMLFGGQLASWGPYVTGLWHGLLGITGKWELHDRWAP